MSWIGGSSKRMFPGGISIPPRIISMTEPLPEMKVLQLTEAFSTSSNRLSA